MTSLFVTMLVLFILSYYNFNQQKKELEVNAEKYKRIQQIDSAIAQIDKRYFVYDPENKRQKLKVDVNFKPNSVEMSDLDIILQQNLTNAGRALYKQMEDITNRNKDVNYLLV